jgi:hypothetical protein
MGEKLIITLFSQLKRRMAINKISNIIEKF